MEEQRPRKRYRGKSKPDGTFTLTYENDYQKHEMVLGADRFIAWMINWLQMVSPEMRRKALERIRKEVN